MKDFNFFDKIGIVVDIIAKKPMLLLSTILGIALIICSILYVKKNIKMNKWILISIWAIALILFIINYNTLILSLLNSILNNVFMSLYFPNISTYAFIIIVSNFFFIYSLISKEIKIAHKLVNISTALVLNIFLVFIIETIKSLGITDYSSITFYTNSSLLVLLEFSTAIFASWILVNLFITIYYKLQKYDVIEEELPEIIFDN